MSVIQMQWLIGCLLWVLLPSLVLASASSPSAEELDCRTAAGFNGRGMVVWRETAYPRRVKRRRG